MAICIIDRGHPLRDDQAKTVGAGEQANSGSQADLTPLTVAGLISEGPARADPAAGFRAEGKGRVAWPDTAGCRLGTAADPRHPLLVATSHTRVGVSVSRTGVAIAHREVERHRAACR